MGDQMTEPTAEQVSAERGRAEVTLKASYAIGDELTPVNDVIEQRLLHLATALARLRIEAHAAGRDDGLREAAEAVDGSDGNWDSVADAIGALRGTKA